MAAKTVVRPIGFRPGEISALLNSEVIDQHAGDAAFLWSSRDRAVRAPHYRLVDIARLDERLEANLDGLRIAGETGHEYAEKQLAPDATGTMFAAAVLAFESKIGSRVDSIVSQSISEEIYVPEVLSSLGWIGAEDALPILTSLGGTENPHIRRLVIAGYELQGINPGELLQRSISAPQAIVRNQALRAAGVLGRKDLAYAVARSIAATEEDSRYFAAWTCARLGFRDSTVLGVLRSIAESRSPYAESAMQMALRCMGRYEAREWIASLLERPASKRLGIQGIGVLGDPALVGELMGFMRSEKFSRVAGESFSMITGVDLKYSDLNQDSPEGFEAGPNDDPDDPEVAMDPDEDLPWPAQELVNRWWKDHGSAFSPEKRYLGGMPIEERALKEVIANGYQRQRLAAALELGLLHPSMVLFNARRPGKRQITEVRGWNL
jgi:uncharacterized protein (TIGR02270 family)